ncbi:MAG: TonB-dependent receptor [Bacteroidaceae bacterium]|nr:TonB-dependent receptor [Bacteroidaceae bacterium]
MRKTFHLTALLLCSAMLCQAQTGKTDEDVVKDLKQDNASFVFTESQLGDDDDMTQNVIMVGSNTNVYTSNVGYLWSPVRFKFRAYQSRYNDIYMNGVQVNNGENGQFNYSTIGGMNDATRNVDQASPFEVNTFSMSSIGGSSNYNLRASEYAAGHKATLSGANRNYTLRGMYTYGSGITDRGWAFFGTIGYRWSNMTTAAVNGTFYNSFSYYMAVQKIFNERHSLNLSTWGSPTERAQQGASTDEAYWLANDYQYNPYWGYQNGKKRASRVVNNFEPSALLTWDFKINDNMKLTTSAFFKYAKYSATRLNYNGQNPAPDYWKNFPSNSYDVWGTDALADRWNDYDGFISQRDYWMASDANRQINFDRLIYANQHLASGKDAIYWIEAKHNDHMATNLGSTFDWNIDKNSKLAAGLQLASNKGMHYSTMEDLLGAQTFHNVNTYAVGNYSSTASQLDFDILNPNKKVGVGDRFRYDYDLYSQNAKMWLAYTLNKGISHNFITAKIGGSQLWRDGHMLNGFYDPKAGWDANASYGKSKTARFLDGGFKIGSTLNLGKGHAVTMGIGYEARAPHANVAFVSPEMNNNFVKNLTTEKIFSAELGYALNISWLRLNVTGYYTHSYDGTEWQNFYFDDVNSFTYVSLTGIEKNFYGAELGAKFKVTSNFDINLIGTYAEAQYGNNSDVAYMLSNKGTTETDVCLNKGMRESGTPLAVAGNNSDVAYMLSNKGTTETDVCLNKGMRESGTPLAVASLGLNYRVSGWYLNLTGNYYDRIYLSYSPCLRYKSKCTLDNDGNPIIPDQVKGKGGFMLDASVGKQFYVAHHPLSVNLTLTNILNNRSLCTGGYEQSRSNYSTNEATGSTSERIYRFDKNPKKFYAQGFNFLLNINYRF